MIYEKGDETQKFRKCVKLQQLIYMLGKKAKLKIQIQ